VIGHDIVAAPMFVNQVVLLADGNILCERLAELDDDCLALLRHVIPAVTLPARPLDVDHLLCPTMSLAHVAPQAKSLGFWWTLAVSNRDDQPVTRRVLLSVSTRSSRLAVFEFATQHFVRVHSPGDSVALRIPAYGTRVLRIIEWDGQSAVLLGTDQHLSGGAAEFEGFEIMPPSICGFVC